MTGGVAEVLFAVRLQPGESRKSASRKKERGHPLAWALTFMAMDFFSRHSATDIVLQCKRSTVSGAYGT
jgi:hypothetical protein